MIIQVLHPRKHIPWFYVAWCWRKAYPKRVRRWDMVKDFDQWMGMMQQRVSIGVFAPTLTALVTLEPTGERVYEVHVDCRRKVSRETLITALLSIETTVFEGWGAREVFAGVISKNQGILRVARECGYAPDGISEQVGELKFIRLRKTDAEYQDQQQQRIEHEHFHPRAGSEQPGYRQPAQHAVSG